MTQALQERTETAPALSEGAAMLSMIERVALNPDADIEKLKGLLDMQERIMARNAKVAYYAAFAQMQPELPEIPEYGRTNNGSYALWEDINELVKPILAKHGFGISFRTGRSPEGKPTVTAILTHAEGHSESTEMELPVDNSGNKNAVQGVGSSTSYGKRYTASALLNLTSRGEDDDGKKTAYRKSKDKARPVYEEMKNYLNEATSQEELQKRWAEKNFQSEFKVLPEDWQGQLIKQKDDLKVSLSVRGPVKVPPQFDSLQPNDVQDQVTP